MKQGDLIAAGLSLGVIALVASTRRSSKTNSAAALPAITSEAFLLPSPGSGISNEGAYGEWNDATHPVAYVFSDRFYDPHLSPQSIYLGVPVHEAPSARAKVTFKLRHKTPIRIDVRNQSGSPREWVRIYHSYYPEQGSDFDPARSPSGDFVASGYVEYKYLCDIRQPLPFCPQDMLQVMT